MRRWSVALQPHPLSITPSPRASVGNFIAREMNTVLFRRVHMKLFMRITSLSGLLALALLAGCASLNRVNNPPAGFTEVLAGRLEFFFSPVTAGSRHHTRIPRDPRRC